MKILKKNSNKAIGIAMAAIMVVSIFAILAPASVADPSVPSGKVAIYYLNPDNSSVPDGFCHTTDVELRVKTTDVIKGGKVSLTFDRSCVNITGISFNTATWNDAVANKFNPLATKTVITFGATSEQPLGDYLIGDLTLHCNSSSSCCGCNVSFVDQTYISNDTGSYYWPADTSVDNGTFICGKPLVVTKQVWNESSSSWIDDLGPLDSSWMGKDVQFKITVTAGCLDLSNVVVDDTMDDSLVYNNSATPTETSNTTHTATWNLGSLAASTSQTITFNATIVGYGKDYNTATATATVDLLGGVVVQPELPAKASVDTRPPAGIDVNKTVWDPAKGKWVKEINSTIDYLDIGDTASEAGHNLQGWSNNQSGVPFTGSNYGGGDDGTFRLLLGPGDGCTDEHRNASFTMNAGAGMANQIVLRHLDGSQNDNFTVYIREDDGSLTEIGEYLHSTPTEDWVTSTFDFPARAGTITFVLNSTGTITGWCGTWGQVAFSWAKLLTDRAKIGDTYRFRCEVHNTGAPGMDLTNIEVRDVISPSLEYADTARLMTPDGVWRSIEPPTSITPYDPVEGTTVNWTINDFLQDPLVLQPCKTFVVEYDITVIDYGLDCNVQYARGYSEAAASWVEDSDDACIDTPKPDLTVTEIEVNADLSGAIGYAFAHNCNSISAVIKETNGVDVADTFYVKFEVDGDEKCRVAVDGIGALEEKTVWCNCSWTPDSIGTVTITVTVDADDDVEEASETNNALDKSQDVIYNGYKGDGWQDGRNITNLQCHEQGTINLTYSTGDSYYLSGYYTKWDNYEVHWMTSDFNIPPTESCIKKARLYAYYHGDRYGDKWANLNMEFNGVPKTHVANYSDGKGFGSWDYSSNYGVLVYDVTSEFLVTSNNIANLTNNNPSEPKGITMEAMLLIVVYNNTETEPDRIIWINEGCDLLSSKYPKYGVSPEEATTYAQFPICAGPIPMNEVVGAKLITVAQTGNLGDDKNRLYFNDVGEWHGLWPDGYVSGTNIGIHEADVRLYLKSTDNIATYQDNGDMFAVANAFLVVEKGEGQIEVVAPEDCVGVSEQFDVLINVTPVIPVYGVEYELSFDSSVIHAEWQNEGDFLKQGGASTNVYINNIDNGAGRVSFAVTRTGVATGATEPGTLATIHFTAVELGASTGLTLTLVKASDPNAQPIPMDTFNSNVAVCDNEPPVAVAKSLFTYNNVGTKYMSKTYLDGSESNDPDGSIINYRWYFGDGNYGTGETYEHVYGSWNWNGAGYDPFSVILTVEDNGVPMMDNSDTIPVNVYIAGDANGDGIVDIFDGVTVGLEWDNTASFNGIYWYDNQRGDRADLNNDQIVDIFDGVIVGANWDHTAY